MSGKQAVFLVSGLCILLSTCNPVQAGGGAPRAHETEAAFVNPRDWAVWKRAVGPKAWQQWRANLSWSEWLAWRASLSPQNWIRWHENMGPEDLEVMTESTFPPATTEIYGVVRQGCPTSR